MKRLREFFESIVFAGMKPGSRPGRMAGLHWLGPWRASVERWLSGSAPGDPLYLTNRTPVQKIKSWSMVAIPCLFIVALVALALSKNFFNPPSAAPQKELSAAEIARKVLPNIARDIQIDTNRDVEVVEVHVDHSPRMKLTGTVKNNTSHAIEVADVVFNLTNALGSDVGAVNGRIENLPPKTSKAFQFPIEQRDAVFALVREVTPGKKL